MSKDNKAELLLLGDVEELGRSGDIVQVKRGYARNFLLPKRKAVVADANAKRIQARLQEERKQKAQEDLKDAEKLKGQLDNIRLKVDVKVDPEGHMYGSIAAHDVIVLLEKEGIQVEKKNVVLAKAIKTTGSHEVPLKLKEGVMASLKVDIIPEGTTLEDLAKVTAPVDEQAEETQEPNKES